MQIGNLEPEADETRSKEAAIGTTPTEIRVKHKGTGCACPYCSAEHCPRCGNDIWDDMRMTGQRVCTHPWHDEVQVK